MKNSNPISVDEWTSSAIKDSRTRKWKFELNGPNQILEFILYIYLNKYWKIYWSEHSFTVLGPEDRCSSWGLRFWRKFYVLFGISILPHLNFRIVVKFDLDKFNWQPDENDNRQHSVVKQYTSNFCIWPWIYNIHFY
jgi:hypothetical protein